MLPKIIFNRYKLQKELQGQSSSKKGLYLDIKTKKLVFVKIDFNSNSLFREYLHQQFFYQRLKKLGSDIIIPKPLEILKADSYTALVMEYVLTKSLFKADVKTRIEAYMKVLKFLEKINTTSNVNKKNGLRRKSAAVQLMTLPYFLLKNLILYFPYAPLFFRSAGLIIRFRSEWTKLTSNWINHGDINVTNVLLRGKKIVVIDFAEAFASHYFFDISRTLNSTWYQVEFHNQFWNHIIKEFRFTTRKQNLLKSFVVFNLMQRLSQRYINSNQETFYIKRLETILKSI